MRIGILGGSFNPVHTQHLRMAEAAITAQKLDKIWFIPVFKPVHKSDVSLLDYPHRLELLQIALAGKPSLQICEIEKELGGPSYTIKTVEALQQRFPAAKFYLLIGGDSLNDLPSWYEIHRLIGRCEFVVISRPGFSSTSPLPDARLNWANCPPSSLSATEIRARLNNADFTETGLDRGVFARILRMNYYQCLDAVTEAALELINPRLAMLPDGLREHIEGVARLAISYALDNGVEPRQAMIAGLAHDLFRIAADDEILRLAAIARGSLKDLEKRLPMLAHGAAAAGFLMQSGIALPDSLIAAICDHTFPEADSPLLTQILVVADTLEPSRGIAQRDRLRNADLTLDLLFKEVLQIKAQRAGGR